MFAMAFRLATPVGGEGCFAAIGQLKVTRSSPPPRKSSVADLTTTGEVR